MSRDPAPGILSRDIAAAQTAFARGDGAASQQAHSAPKTPGSTNEAGHLCGERSLEKAFVYGAFEGIAAASTLCAAGFAVFLPIEHITKLVLGGVFALGSTVALREYERARESRAHFFKEREREAWELKNYPEGACGNVCQGANNAGSAVASSV